MIRLLAILALCFIGQAAYAADSSSGCGPSWYVLKDNSLVSSAARFTTNGFSSPIVTLGMTFGTSNCAKHKIVYNDKRGLHFVTHNMHNLVAQTAMGSGEHLGVLATTFGCDWRVQDQFNRAMQANFDGIFGTEEVEGTAAHEAMINVITDSPILAASCSVTRV